MGLGLPSARDGATQSEIEHLVNTMSKDTEREYLAHSHTLHILTQFNHWPMKALESNPLKLPTLHIFRLVSTIKDLELDNLPSLLHSNDIAASLRAASQAGDGARIEKRQTLQGTMGTKDLRFKISMRLSDNNANPSHTPTTSSNTSPHSGKRAFTNGTIYSPLNTPPSLPLHIKDNPQT